MISNNNFDNWEFERKIKVFVLIYVKFFRDEDLIIFFVEHVNKLNTFGGSAVASIKQAI